MNDPNRPKKIDEGDGVFSSSLARAADHFSAKDTDPADQVEIWAKRVGRFFPCSPSSGWHGISATS
ncbi:MAG: hypothetical protein ACRDBL_02625 [Rhabdaerophilum sp.]